MAKFIAGTLTGLIVGFIAYHLPENQQVSYVGGMIAYLIVLYSK